ncbi:antioxidant, AhpC/Tsa family protein [Gonapodya prolifera JEL478]|uniref:Thioredoxin-dependent peroxiredoxin n=1 Tax=Gonapodya prolifera (strain JEL478) TaxID=1344416 RepID=A0A139AY54_GONPJ|nr:antioxidant, AhpC/Tsa family protein [Gonapodya prolifera JEL478]|eukprot:KXS21681.1 antioxidant, AhpC/Tsa family protein [Gonapodya prolifera JEL478]
MAPIKVGDKLPYNIILRRLVPKEGEGTFCRGLSAGANEQIKTEDLFKGKKVVLAALPGAFTPTCSNSHVPGFIDHYDQLKAAGVDTVGIVSVNDQFTMAAWGKVLGADPEKIQMLADGSADFTQAIGLELDLVKGGLGIRSKRYALVADDGVVTYLGVDAASLKESAAEAVLEFLGKK